MRRISSNLILAVGLILTLGWVTETLAAGNDRDVKRPKNAGILSVQVTFAASAQPAAYRVLVDGVEVGIAGNATPAEFYLSPGIHTVEIEGPNDQIFVREVEIRRGVKNCICLRVVERRDTRPCPYDVRVEAPEEVEEGALVTFVAVNAISASAPVNYRWRVTPDTVRVTGGGDGTPSITVDTTGLGSQTITAELDVTDDVSGPTCYQKDTTRTRVKPPPPPVLPERTRCDVFESTSFDDDKYRFDNCVIQLRNRPDAQLYIIIYQGTDRLSRARTTADLVRRRTMDYLVRTRGVDPRRIQIIMGGTRPRTSLELWIVPPGASLPVPND
ncbi:MAG TPA: hypothetical protein VK400_04720 [Pyrinomonadaceae bacterium]|nr:hypothetical protein [Pyrinomonadaceae bacterium]